MNRSSSNSVDVNDTGSPARITSWLSSSSTKSPTTSWAPLSTVVTPVRRSNARSRSTTSSMLNGLVT
ncbi:Uncharacterised protein [Mycobacterium tuberculosis]|nr:Uncharacterised protein [Mycobacterium tuberculosis]CKU30562.1 Uncharacterised protein [Mycobacterium tuberculosis]